MRTETCADTGNNLESDERKMEYNVSGMNRGRQAGYIDMVL